MVAWGIQARPCLAAGYQDNLSALIHEPTFKTAAGAAVLNLDNFIVRPKRRVV